MITRSRRKTVAFYVRDAHTLEVRAPQRMPDAELRRLIAEKENWIRKALENAARTEAQSRALPPLRYEELQALAQKAQADLPPRIRYWSERLHVAPMGVTIRNQKTRWGSCSSKGRLNLNCLLMEAPESVRDYVVVHELCHLLEMNHSPRFWRLVESVLPGYRQSVEWLRIHGRVLILRMTGAAD